MEGIAQIKTAFERDGFYHIKGFFDADTVRAISAAIEEVGKKPQFQKNILNANGLQFFSSIFMQSEYLREIIAHPDLVQLAMAILGPDVWVRWDQAINKAPGGAEFPWHQDNGYYRLRVPHLQLLITLSENYKENGGLQLVKNSHTRGLVKHRTVGGHEVIVDTPQEKEIMYVDAQPGDLVLFSSYTFHYTGVNYTDAYRRGYVVEYMNLYDFDPYADAPYFVVARHGKRVNQIQRFYPGILNIWSAISQSDLIVGDFVKKVYKKVFA